MSEITELAGGQLNGTASITIELIEANDTPAVVIVRWPDKPSVLHPRLFPAAADTAARIFAAASWAGSATTGAEAVTGLNSGSEPATAAARPTRR